MFIYLNLCPKFMWRWINLYVDLLQNSPPDIIVQTLNRILYEAKKNNDKSVFNITKSLFIKITKNLSLDETYSKLTHKNQSKVNSFSIHTQNLKGKPIKNKLLHFFSFILNWLLQPIITERTITIQFIWLMKKEKYLHQHSFPFVSLQEIGLQWGWNLIGHQLVSSLKEWM